MNIKDAAVMADLLEVEGTIIGMEAMFKGEELLESGAIKNNIAFLMNDPMTELAFMGMSTEAAISKGIWGRLFGRLNVFFSTNADSRNAKRARDLDLLNSAAVDQRPSVLRFNKESINLFLNAWNYQMMRKEDIKELEMLRGEFLGIINDPSSEFGKALRTYLIRIPITFPIAILSIPLAFAWIFVTDVVIYYYLITCVLASIEKMSVLGGGREDFMRLISNMIGSIYMNGSGKSVKFDKNGHLPVSELQRIKVDIESATSRMRAAFGAVKSGTPVDYREKLDIVKMLQEARITIQSKYSGLSNNKMVGAYNKMAKSINSNHLKERGYSEWAIYCANVADVMGAIVMNSRACDECLTTIVRDLYKA